MSTPRIRVFAGPNGSGKSTLAKRINEKYPTEVFINADNIATQLRSYGVFDGFSDLGLRFEQNHWDEYLISTPARSLIQKAHNEGQEINLVCEAPVWRTKYDLPNEYDGALISAFVRSLSIKSKSDFAYETVFSHQSKLTEMRDAHYMGYKLYFYFVCTDSPEINKSRVRNRVLKGGHNVPDSTIENRYFRSLNLLKDALIEADKSYLFDNSGEIMIPVATVKHGQFQLLVEAHQTPNWLVDSVINKFL